MRPKPFRSPEELRAWFAKNSREEKELWLLFKKVGSGKKSVTYPEALDEALAVGWIDGIRKSVDEESYTQRFTPRRKGSCWSSVNVAKAEALIAAGRMAAEGLAAFRGRDGSEPRRSSFGNRPQNLPPEALTALRKSKKAVEFWKSQPPSYRKAATWYVVSAKKEDTRAKRLKALIELAEHGKRLI